MVLKYYGNTSLTRLAKLIVLNNILLRILQHKSYKIHNIKLYKTYCTFTFITKSSYIYVQVCYSQRAVTFCIFNIFRGKCINALIRHHDSRWKHKFHTFTVFSDYGKEPLNINGLNF